MVGDSEWITVEEKELVHKLRERVRNVLPQVKISKPEEDQDAFLLRWLRARDLKLDKAEAMLLNALKWRKENDVDNALHFEVDPFFRETYKWAFVGVDKESHPVIIGPFNEWDFRKLSTNNKSMEEFTTFANNFFECIMENIRIQNEKRKPGQAPVTQFLVVADINQYSYGQMLSFSEIFILNLIVLAMRKWFQLASTYEAYYPEILFKAVFINCPSYFQLFLSMLKGVFAPKTLGKFDCYTSLEEWKKDVEKFIDPSNLPVKYGGTNPSNPFFDISSE